MPLLLSAPAGGARSRLRSALTLNTKPDASQGFSSASLTARYAANPTAPVTPRGGYASFCRRRFYLFCQRTGNITLQAQKHYMRILDIDLDFFLDNKRTSSVTSTKRLDDYYVPWSEDETKAFLEQRCGLTTSNKKQGKFFIHHVEVFDYLRSLQEQHNFVLTFSIDHVDAHADLGTGDSSYSYIATDILPKNLRERAYPVKRNGWSGLSSGNFLAFAVACRWITSLNYINNPEWFDDLQWFNFENFDDEANNLQLKQYSEAQMHQIIYSGGDMRESARAVAPQSLEPLVPFAKVDFNEFTSDGNYDMVFLTQSPGFTPANSDNLIPLIMSYIDII
jgi:hypothetical protein